VPAQAISGKGPWSNAKPSNVPLDARSTLTISIDEALTAIHDHGLTSVNAET